MSATDWSYPLEELKHSIRLHILCAGGVTLHLSQVGLKMIDVFETIRDGNSPAVDMNALSSSLVKSVIDGVEQRMTMLGSEEGTNLAMAIAKEKLSLPKNNLHHKGHFLRILAQAHRDLARLTGSTYPEVTNLDGDVL